MSRFVRAETPNFDDCRKYRPFLRRDFRQLCAYCERSEAGLGGEESFEIDHFRPSWKFPELDTHYPNLYYACRKCNLHKSGTWPLDGLLIRGFRFADPCEEDMYVEHLRESSDGRLEPRTACGQYTRDHIRLNRWDLLRWRQLRHEIAVELRRLESLKKFLGDMLTTITDTVIKDDIREHLVAIEAMIVRGREQFSL